MTDALPFEVDAELAERIRDGLAAHVAQENARRPAPAPSSGGAA